MRVRRQLCCAAAAGISGAKQGGLASPLAAVPPVACLASTAAVISFLLRVSLWGVVCVCCLLRNCYACAMCVYALSISEHVNGHVCVVACAGLFEALLGPEDAVISDELNHASIIDGIRLCKAKRYR